LHKASNQARQYNYVSNNGITHNWLEYYRHEDIRSNQIYVNEWNQMDEILSHRSDSPHLYQPYVLDLFYLKDKNEEFYFLVYHQMKKHFGFIYVLN